MLPPERNAAGWALCPLICACMHTHVTLAHACMHPSIQSFLRYDIYAFPCGHSSRPHFALSMRHSHRLFVQVRRTGRYVVQVAIYEARNMPQVWWNGGKGICISIYKHVLKDRKTDRQTSSIPTC